MKTRKLLAIALVAVMLVAALTACGGTDDPTPSTDPNPSNNNTPTTTPTSGNNEPTEATTKYVVPTSEAAVWQAMSLEDMQDESIDGKTVVYQFMGYASQDRNVSVLMELYDDGFARIYQYSEGGNGQINYIYYGYWTPVEDEYIYTAYLGYSYEGVTREDMGIYNGDLATLDYSYELYDQDGQYSFSINAPLGFQNGGQYVRSAEVTGDGTVQYTTMEAWLAEADAHWAELQGTTEPEETTGEETAALPENALVVDNWAADLNARITASFYAESSAWGTAFAGAGTYEPTDSEEVLFVMNTVAGEPYTLTFYANGTYQFDYPNMGASEKGTFTWEGWTLTVTTDGGQVFAGRINK